MDPLVRELLQSLMQTTGQSEQELAPFAAQWAPAVAQWKAAGMTQPIEELATAAGLAAASSGIRLQAAGERWLVDKFRQLAGLPPSGGGD